MHTRRPVALDLVFGGGPGRLRLFSARNLARCRAVLERVFGGVPVGHVRVAAVASALVLGTDARRANLAAPAVRRGRRDGLAALDVLGHAGRDGQLLVVVRGRQPVGVGLLGVDRSDPGLGLLPVVHVLTGLGLARLRRALGAVTQVVRARDLGVRTSRRAVELAPRVAHSGVDARARQVAAHEVARVRDPLGSFGRAVFVTRRLLRREGRRRLAVRKRLARCRLPGCRGLGRCSVARAHARQALDAAGLLAPFVSHGGRHADAASAVLGRQLGHHSRDGQWRGGHDRERGAHRRDGLRTRGADVRGAVGVGDLDRLALALARADLGRARLCAGVLAPVVRRARADADAGGRVVRPERQLRGARLGRKRRDRHGAWDVGADAGRLNRGRDRCSGLLSHRDDRDRHATLLAPVGCLCPSHRGAERLRSRCDRRQRHTRSRDDDGCDGHLPDGRGGGRCGGRHRGRHDGGHDGRDGHDGHDGGHRLGVRLGVRLGAAGASGVRLLARLGRLDRRLGGLRLCRRRHDGTARPPLRSA
eukprot:scaffold110105_cov67-Phaeocystis_antarctica.AAC.5